ncbi:hypothetical protein JW899_04570 [Candidatus Uhrbacteria bacterium]|nr:hypothetical protein [Candidatus Uhrbacteria bacterium]
MSDTVTNPIAWKRLFPVVASLAVLVAMTAVFANDWRKVNMRNEDRPPVLEFTWTPLGEVDLKDFRGVLKITDDYGLDFTSYRMHIAETGKTYDMPIPGMMGREYEAPISLGLLANNPDIYGKRQVTLRFEITDDRGQLSELERVVRIRPPVGEQVIGFGDSAVEGTFLLE